MKLVRLTSSGVGARINGFDVGIKFYPYSWTLTHCIEVSKRNFIPIQVYANLGATNEIIERLNAGGKETQKMWLVLRFINNLSYRVKNYRLMDYLLRDDFNKLLKSIFYSLCIRKYKKVRRVEIIRIVKSFIRLGKVKSSNKWAQKIINIEKSIFWKKVFGTANE